MLQSWPAAASGALSALSSAGVCVRVYVRGMPPRPALSPPRACVCVFVVDIQCPSATSSPYLPGGSSCRRRRAAPPAGSSATGTALQGAGAGAAGGSSGSGGLRLRIMPPSGTPSYSRTPLPHGQAPLCWEGPAVCTCISDGQHAADNATHAHHQACTAWGQETGADTSLSACRACDAGSLTITARAWGEQLARPPPAADARCPPEPANTAKPPRGSGQASAAHVAPALQHMSHGVAARWHCPQRRAPHPWPAPGRRAPTVRC